MRQAFNFPVILNCTFLQPLYIKSFKYSDCKDIFKGMLVDQSVILIYVVFFSFSLFI